jgi:class 3 adenylate cyclase
VPFSFALLILLGFSEDGFGYRPSAQPGARLLARPEMLISRHHQRARGIASASSDAVARNRVGRNGLEPSVRIVSHRSIARCAGECAAVQEIAEWLDKLGMSEYAQRFADSDIDFTILGDLIDQDLEKIGVASLGHRRKLLRAIATLNTGQAATAGPSASDVVAATAAPSPSAAPNVAGERRHLTVLFCDLVGSTEISAQLDAEEWRDLVGSYLDAASAAVVEMGGHVAKKLGDGLLALFGYPLAHENDVERAVRAALSIQRALNELNRKNAARGKPELTARIGLDTGPAVVDATGEIYGDVANIAARVQALAEPGSVLITAQVQRQVAGLFVAEERGSHALKGVTKPTALYRLVRASGGGRRSGQRNLTPLVGREDEMATLTRRWQRVRQGEGQLVLIVGEPGLGKSRLIEGRSTRLA